MIPGSCPVFPRWCRRGPPGVLVEADPERERLTLSTFAAGGAGSCGGGDLVSMQQSLHDGPAGGSVGESMDSGLWSLEDGGDGSFGVVVRGDADRGSAVSVEANVLVVRGFGCAGLGADTVSVDGCFLDLTVGDGAFPDNLYGLG